MPSVEAAQEVLQAWDGVGFRADAAELATHAALLAGDAETAQAEAVAAATLRRAVLDHRDVPRALALQAEAARGNGTAAVAAGLYLRAGRGAAARGEVEEERRWLGMTRDLAGRAGVREVEATARAVLGSLVE